MHFTDCGLATLSSRYVLPGETPGQLFCRVADAYGSGILHSQRLLTYMQNRWFMPATPILTNAGTKRGLPISCFVNEVEDTMESIANTAHENVFLAANGGGIGSYWGNVRSITEKCGAGETSGVIPFLKMQESQNLAIAQGSFRRGASAAYLSIDHPEIEDFIDIRKPANGADVNRRCLELHHGVVITDDFMDKIGKPDAEQRQWHLRSPHTNKILKTLDARELWISILTARLETGEPYILFKDNANRHVPAIYRELNLEVTTSNLCTEIMLHTGKDYNNRQRTAVCCLSSVNLEYYEDWCQNDEFIFDVLLFLDNALQDFIDRGGKYVNNAVYSATQERSVGLGVMGFHSLLQKNMMVFGSDDSHELNRKIFTDIQQKVDACSQKLADWRGPCPDAMRAGVVERFTHKTAIAPTATISIICDGASPGVEPFIANTYTQKTLSGSFPAENKFLKDVLHSYGQDTPDVWQSIKINGGSVQHLDFLAEREKMVFLTAFEIDQRAIIRLAAERQPFIDQGQSINLFFPTTVSKAVLQKTHFLAWELRLKSLYYCRSQSLQRADAPSGKLSVCTVCE